MGTTGIEGRQRPCPPSGTCRAWENHNDPGECAMKSNPKISAAVAAILSAQATAVVWAGAETTPATGAGNELQEVIVTAERRAESVQDVPITIQALTSETLAQLNVKTFDDFVKYLPNVTAGGYGPGQSNVFIRGLATSIGGTQGVGATGSFPNVATYLDDQSGQVPGRNLDIYAADLERIEILEGPQGTLFGAGAQAGVIRYITNKPKLNVTEASFSGGYGVTAGGDPNSDITAVFNLPLITDTLAVRGVVYDDRRGGYINNVAGTFTRDAARDLSINYANFATGCSSGVPVGGVCTAPGATVTAFGVPPGSPVINNNALASRAINPVTYQGLRVSALWKIRDDWTALI